MSYHYTLLVRGLWDNDPWKPFISSIYFDCNYKAQSPYKVFIKLKFKEKKKCCLSHSELGESHGTVGKGVRKTEEIEDTRRTRSYETEQNSCELIEVEVSITGPPGVCTRSSACKL